MVRERRGGSLSSKERNTKVGININRWLSFHRGRRVVGRLALAYCGGMSVF